MTAYQQSHTSNDNYAFNGEAPETILSGQTEDISPFIELKWFEFVKFIPLGASFPDLDEDLGQWLGPTINIGPVMTSKIINLNGQVLHLSSYCPLNSEEQESPKEQTLQDKFDCNLIKKLGDLMTPEDLKELRANTVSSEFYGDNIEGTYTDIPDINNVPQEHHNTYVNTNVVVPLGGALMKGTVTGHTTDRTGR